ncbi:putative glycerol kinase 5 [Daphnia carinata]|uniref:putative glycerol kinase 5 n=1 Tax=Daphnia carinata TaxID=120202 RepID=UPI00257CCA6B|nr:putative glycerol kinase 5 [Daphnia carinata]XP_057370615.1 putative glycerol kinase 5 [Daphnia carinata]XP_057370616.1 putative glycerol kinase 5 [Daphnia carinata]
MASKRGDKNSKRSSSAGRKLIASVDFGTTSVRCFLFDHQGRVRSSAAVKVNQIYPQQGWNEIDPEDVWTKFRTVFKQALENADADASDIKVFGLTTQRGSFVTWDKRTGKPFHNFITWKDLRADYLVKSWNNSWTIQGIRLGSIVLHKATRNKRYLAGSAFKFMNGLVSLRLRWALDHHENLRQAAQEGHALLGTIETYLIYRLTQGRIHATDYSNVCVSGLWDPYTFQWVDWLINMLDIPKSMLPEIKDSCGSHWGSIHKNVFGAEIPIHCVVSDQGASLFGSLSFNQGDVRLTMGTGSFVSYNTSDKPHASVSGLYPVVGWKIGDEVVFIAEGHSTDTATVIEWCREIDLFEDYDEIEKIITSIPNSDDVFFVPAFSGIQAPVNDETVATGFIGIKPSTRKAHLLRAAIESLAFRVYQMCQLMYQETGQVVTKMRVDGGVSRNDFLMQLISDLTMMTIDRPVFIESAAHGAALMAGLSFGIWRSRSELQNMRQTERVFFPVENRWLDYAPLYSSWKNAVRRLCHWY